MPILIRREARPPSVPLPGTGRSRSHRTWMKVERHVLKPMPSQSRPNSDIASSNAHRGRRRELIDGLTESSYRPVSAPEGPRRGPLHFVNASSPAETWRRSNTSFGPVSIARLRSGHEAYRSPPKGPHVPTASNVGTVSVIQPGADFRSLQDIPGDSGALRSDERAFASSR